MRPVNKGHAIKEKEFLHIIFTNFTNGFEFTRIELVRIEIYTNCTNFFELHKFIMHEFKWHEYHEWMRIYTNWILQEFFELQNSICDFGCRIFSIWRYANSIHSWKFVSIRAIRVNLPEAAIGQMIINHASGLHVGVANSGAEKFEAASFHVLADGVGYGRARGYFIAIIDNWFTARHEAV